MPPKRPRIVPSQTDLSVQDVRDYSTPEGAAMANEEMRRLKMAIQATREQVDTAAGAGQAGGAGAAGTATAEQYIWSISVNSELVGEAIPTGTKVNFIAGEGVTITRNGSNITISAIADMSWVANADSGSINVPGGSFVRFTGTNGVSTTADTGTKSIIINRPLQIKKRGVEIGGPDTVSLDFWVEHSQHNAKATEHVYFEVIDLEDGERRIKGWVTPGAYSWNFITNTNVAETVDDTEQVSFLGGANVTVTNVGNVITISANAAAGTLQLQQEGVNIGPNDTAVINWDNDTALKPAGYTSRVWTEVINDGGGVRRLIAWYEPGAGGTYYWNLQANGGAIEQIDNAETVNFAAGGNLTVARAGNTITYSYTQPAAYYWNLQAAGGAIEQIDTTETVNFTASGNLAVTRTGNTINYSYTQPAAYYWGLQANGGAVEQIDTTESVNFAASGSLSVARTGNTITYSYTQPAAYYWNIQANGGPTEQIDTTESVNFAAGGDLTVARTGNTITYSYSQPAAYSWVASNGPTDVTVSTTNEVTWLGDSGVTVSLNAATKTFTIDRPLQIEDDGVAVGDDATVSIDFDSNGGTGTSYAEFEVTDVGGGERRVRVKYNAGAGQYWWNLQAAGGAIEQIDSNETVNFVAAGDITVARAGNTITYTYNQPAAYYWNLQASGGATEKIDTTETVNFTASGNLVVTRTGNTIDYSYTQPAAYSWVASNGPTDITISSTNEVTWVGDSGVVVSLDSPTKTFTIDRPLQIEDDGTAVGADDTTTINFDSNGGTGTSYAEFEVADIGGGERRVRVKYNAGAGQYWWNIQANGGAIEQIDSNETVNFAAGGDITVARVGNTITYSYTQPAAYYWNIQANGGATEQISTTETVNFAASGNLTVTRTGNTITYGYTQPAAYYWGLQANGGAIEQIDTTEAVNFAASGNLTVSRTGNTITYGYTQPAAYYWNLQANGGAIEQIDTTEAVNFAASGNLTVSRTGNTITYGYTQPAAYYWNLQANGGAIEQIDTNEAVNFAAGGNLTVARAGNTITYSYTQPAAYDWYAGDGSTSTQISAGEFVRWQGDSGVVVSLNTSTQTFTIDRPLQLQQEGTNIGNDSTVTINWDNATVSKPIGHTGRVWTEIIDDGAGTRRLIAWYEPGAGAYYWNLQANGGAIEQIDTAESVNFTASGNLTVTRTGNTINYSYSEPTPYKWVASDGTNVADITANETVVITGDATTTVTFNSGTQTFTISRPLTIKQSGTAVGNNNTRDINFANATLTKPAGYTAQGWVEVTDNPANGANRDIKVFFEPPTSTYGWNIEADSPLGTSAAVANGATVKIAGANGIKTTRVNDDIFISIDPDYNPSDPTASLRISGFIEFSNSAADYIGAVPYRYGTRQYVDIQHNFGLGNQNAFELHLIDVNHDDTGLLISYRSGSTTMSGEIVGQSYNAQSFPAGHVKFRNIPHWAAIDSNTIRVWATMSRGKPTNMKFWYTLRAL